MKKPIAAAAAAAVVFAVAGGSVYAASRPDPDTPCEASTAIVADIRRQADAGHGGTVAYVGGDYGSMLRRIVSGEWEDVEGPVSPELRAALYALATDLETLSPYDPPAGQFTSGETGRRMDAVLAACR